MKKQMVFLYAKWLKNRLKNKFKNIITNILHFYYSYVKNIDFLPNKDKIYVYLNYCDMKKITYCKIYSSIVL